MRNEFTVEQPNKKRTFTFINVAENPDKETLRQDIVEHLCSPQGIAIDFWHLHNGVREISSIITFHIVGEQLTVRDELGDFAIIQFKDSTVDVGMLDIHNKEYLESQNVYRQQGVMEMAFSLLCEYARDKKYKRIGGKPVHDLADRNVNRASILSRYYAIDLTSDMGDTYADKTTLDSQTGELTTIL